MTNAFRLLHPKALLFGFCIGIIFVALYTPQPKVVYKFPSPYNQDTVYMDKSDNCYKYEAKKVECSGNAERQPLMEDFSPVPSNVEGTVR